MSKVSICIPAYNQPRFIKRLLDSILTQTYNNYEIIITDDSNDNSVSEIVQSYKDIRIKYYKNMLPLGSPLNWNEAINKSDGDYFKIMHHDDWFKDEFSLENFVNSIEENNDCFVFSQSESFNYKGYISCNCPTNDSVNDIKTNPMQLFLSNDIGDPSTTIFKKSELKFDENLKWFVDVEFYARFIKLNSNIFYINKPLVCIGVHPDQVTHECMHDKKLIYKEFLYSFNKLYDQKITSKLNFYKVYYFFLIQNPVKSFRELKDYANSSLDYLQVLLFNINNLTKNIKRFSRQLTFVLFKSN